MALGQRPVGFLRLAAAPARGAGLAAHFGRPLEGPPSWNHTCLSRVQQAKLVCLVLSLHLDSRWLYNHGADAVDIACGRLAHASAELRDSIDNEQECPHRAEMVSACSPAALKTAASG